MVANGMSDEIASTMLELTEAFNTGKVKSVEPFQPKNIVATKFADFARQSFRRKKAAA